MTKIVPVGDQAVLIYFADEAAALRFAAAVRADDAAWLVDVVQAYASVGVFFDLDQTRSAEAAAYLRRLDEAQTGVAASVIGRLHRIPCCYEMQLDLARVAEHTRLSAEEMIRRHSETEYTVYAIGFCPGVPHLGYLPTELCC